MDWKIVPSKLSDLFFTKLSFSFDTNCYLIESNHVSSNSFVSKAAAEVDRGKGEQGKHYEMSQFWYQ